MDGVLNCLVTDSIGPGEFTEKFIKSAKEIFGYDSAIALRSPYFALVQALGLLGLGPGTKVAISPLAPLYHLMAVQSLGMIPVLIDHDAETCLPLLDSIKENACSCLVLFEAFGMLPLREEVKALEIPVIEDMSQSLGAERLGQKAGSIGNLSMYGLEEGSLVTAGGGALLFAVNKKDAFPLRNAAETMLPELGITDYNAALGISQLRGLHATLDKRKSLEQAFQMELARTRHKTFKQADDGQGGMIGFPIVLETSMKDAVFHARKNGVEAAPAFERSIIAMEGFEQNSNCPGCRILLNRCILFPLHEKIGSADSQILKRIIASLP
jgi:dTDP-4-amino-4,6-dideoxygalactose transaminase